MKALLLRTCVLARWRGRLWDCFQRRLMQRLRGDEIGEDPSHCAQPRSLTTRASADVIMWFLPWTIGNRHDMAESK